MGACGRVVSLRSGKEVAAEVGQERPRLLRAAEYVHVQVVGGLRTVGIRIDDQTEAALGDPPLGCGGSRQKQPPPRQPPGRFSERTVTVLSKKEEGGARLRARRSIHQLTGPPVP